MLWLLMLHMIDHSCAKEMLQVACLCAVLAISH